MLYYDTLGEAGTDKVSVGPPHVWTPPLVFCLHCGCVQVVLLFPLWVMTVRPYLTAVGEWMVSGVLQDRHHELCIVRSAKNHLRLRNVLFFAPSEMKR